MAGDTNRYCTASSMPILVPWGTMGHQCTTYSYCMCAYACSFNCAFTGADSNFYEPTKVAMKAAVSAFGVNVPAWALINHYGERAKVHI